MYPQIVRHIQALLDKQDVVTVAISGHGGSGKTTLANALADHFDINNEQIIKIDSLHAKGYLEAKGIYEQHEWGVLIDALRHSRESNRLQYETRDWKGIEGKVDVPRPKVLTVEGIRLIRPEFLPYFDVSIWIDCPLETATARALERNRQQGDSKEELELWHTKWVPEAKLYIKDAQPRKIADFVYTEYES